MEVTRILSLRQFDGNKCRFSNVVFKHSSGSSADTPDGKLGISVFRNDCACAAANSDCLCGHAKKFYDGVFPQPCAYWTFDTDLLDPPNPNPQGIPKPEILNVKSKSGDDCHYNIHHVSDSRAQKFFEKRVQEGFLGICSDGKALPFECETAVQLKKAFFPDPS